MLLAELKHHEVTLPSQPECKQTLTHTRRLTHTHKEIHTPTHTETRTERHTHPWRDTHTNKETHTHSPLIKVFDSVRLSDVLLCRLHLKVISDHLEGNEEVRLEHFQ